MKIIEQANKIRQDINVLTTSLTDEQGLALVSLFEPWTLKAYAIGDRVKHQGKLYKCVQAHTSQSDWLPNATPALYSEVTPPGSIAPWAQPFGAHDAYAIGDKVTHNGKTWISTTNANVWKPGVYGWDERT